MDDLFLAAMLPPRSTGRKGASFATANIGKIINLKELKIQSADVMDPDRLSFYQLIWSETSSKATVHKLIVNLISLN